MNTVIRVLLVEDDPISVMLLEQSLADLSSHSIKIEHVERLSPAICKVGEDCPDLILLDLGLPDSVGVDTFIRMKAYATDVPIVVLTGAADDSLASDALRMGAQDYIAKGSVDGPGLERSIRYAIERHRAEKALRTSEERFRIAAECASDHIYEYDMAEQRITHYSHTYDTLGYSPDDYPRTADDRLALVHPDDRDHVRQTLKDALAGDSLHFSLVYSIAAKDGARHYFQEKAQILRNKDGTPRKIIGVITDVTSQEKAESALRASECFNRLLIEQSPLGISIFQNDKCRYVNPAFLRMFDYQGSDEVLGAVMGRFLSSEHREIIAESRRKTQDELSSFAAYELKARKKGCQVFDVSVWPTCIDYLGEPAVLLFIADMSEWASLKTQLFQAQKMEALGVLAGGVAHDFNNLLTVILGFSQLMLVEKTEDDPEYDDLQRIVQAGHDGAQLVRQLMSFSKKVDIKQEPVNLNTHVHQFRKMLTRVIPKMVEIEIVTPPEPALVSADPVQINQILMNLTVNARDAMPDTGVLRIQVANVCLYEDIHSTKLDVKVGEYVALSVSDTGTGMDKATLERIYEPFFTTKEVGRGTGLGLPVVFGIVQQHHGFIECSSELGRGTTFTIFIPAIESATPHVGDFVQEQNSRGGTETILLVDDEADIRRLGTRILEKADYHVLTAENGRKALEIYEERGADISLVILDLIMPVMGGKQCLDELVHMDSSVKILIASGHFSEVPEFEGPGAPIRLTKPFKVRQMLDAVRTALDAG